jgi:hypothetical protein
MNILYLIILAFLGFIALIYTYTGLKFSLTTRKHQGLILYFILGLLIGIIGGLIVFYNLKITEDALYFNIRFGRWWFVTILSIFFGGLISLLFYLLKEAKRLKSKQ